MECPRRSDLQEKEGPGLLVRFLNDSGLTAEEIGRVSFLVGHHHTYTTVDGPDYRILIEADYLVNAEENNFTAEHVKSTYGNIFRTKTGTRLLKNLYSF